MTGINFMSTELISKRLNLILELVPQVKVIGYLSAFPNSSFAKEWIAHTMEAAKALGKEIVMHEVRQSIDIEKAFASFVEQDVTAITVAPDSFFGDPRHSRAVIELASRYKMPAVYGARSFPRMGGLMSYTADCAACGTSSARNSRADPQRCKACGSPGPAAHQIRTHP